jgi:hypothetical protein
MFFPALRLIPNSPSQAIPRIVHITSIQLPLLRLRDFLAGKATTPDIPGSFRFPRNNTPFDRQNGSIDVALRSVSCGRESHRTTACDRHGARQSPKTYPHHDDHHARAEHYGAQNRRGAVTHGRCNAGGFFVLLVAVGPNGDSREEDRLRDQPVESCGR